MKKRFSIILCLLLALLLTACAPTEVPDTTTTENSDEIPTTNRISSIEYHGTFEELIQRATDVVIGEYYETRQGFFSNEEILQFAVTKRFLGDERNKTVSVFLKNREYQIEGTDIVYNEYDLNFEKSKLYLLILNRHVNPLSYDVYYLRGCIYLPMDDFSAFTLYNEAPKNHVEGKVPNNEEELYQFIQDHINPENPKYTTRLGLFEQEGLRGDELLRYAAKEWKHLSQIELVEFVEVQAFSGGGYQTYLCRDLNSDSEELIPIRFPLEYPLAESDQYTAIVSDPIQPLVSHGDPPPKYWRLYGRYALWPVEAYTELKAKWLIFAEE